MNQVQIPNKLFFRIGEVCKLLDLEAYVLRFWEKEFPTLSPAKGANGRRMYRKKDVEMVLSIKGLLYEKGFTIAGAKKILANSRNKESLADLLWSKNLTEKSSSSVAAHPSPIPAEKLSQLKNELRNILTILKRRC